MAPIKSSLARTVGKLFGVQKDSDLSLRGDVQSNRKISSSVQASGGTEIVTATKKYHVFLGSSEQNFTVTQGGTCEVLVVAGGGSGGYFYGAGGGAGGGYSGGAAIGQTSGGWAGGGGSYGGTATGNYSSSHGYVTITKI